MNKKFRYLFCLTIISFLISGTDGTIRGRIISLSSGQPLPGAQVFIAAEGVGAVSDIDGNYLLLNVPIGEHTVQVSMIGYKIVKSDLMVSMDKTTWHNVSLEAAAIEGETVYISGEKKLVEKGRTAKKVTINKEAIEALPIKDISGLYELQAGVVKIEGQMQGGVPGNEERGLEEVHVRGGRSGEIAYMIDGLYIRNPIYGGIGSGTRLNLFAVREFDWQPGGFNAEYGDAMSAVSNMHTMAGGKKYQFKYKYETSLLGAAAGNIYDELRDYNDHTMGFGGPIPFIKNLTFWVSGQTTNHGSYSVYEFDNSVFQDNDPGNDINRENLVAPWDTYEGMHGFGFGKTNDIFSKISYKIGQFKMNISHWVVENHRQSFNRSYTYWNDGQNEIFRDTDRTTFEINHTVTPKLFYTLRLSNFNQGFFQGVRWKDSDSDGYPDWYEWSHGAGSRTYSDPYNSEVVPYSGGDLVQYINKDGRGPDTWTSGWYLGANPGNYNWEVAEDWNDANGNKVYDLGESFTDVNGNYVWDGPELVEKALYRDGSYWLTPQMYVDNEQFQDDYYFYREYDQDPYNAYHDPESNLSDHLDSLGVDFEAMGELYDSLYFLPTSSGSWSEGYIFGGSDTYYGSSNANTKEVRLDITSQFTNSWRSRVGIDYKSHRLEFSEILMPWLDDGAFRQRFAEQWDDYGTDGIHHDECDTCDGPTDGEGDGIWQEGEPFDDFNGNGSWDNYVEPIEISGYWQNTYEVPWMVINAGIRLDVVNYNTKIWADPLDNFSSSEPWFYLDWGLDGIPDTDDTGEDDGEYTQGGNGQRDGYNQDCTLCGNEEYEDLNNNNLYDYGEPFIDEGEPAGKFSDSTPTSKVIFKPSTWLYELSPRVGFSHIITDKSTFTFNYGVYHQTPKYERIYLNTNRLEDPQEVFEDSGAGWIGNATMAASRTQSYEAAFNVQAGPKWAYTVGLWVKDMDGLVTAKTHRTGIYEYQVADNGDFGRATGIDLTLENKGLINTTLQYTYSVAKANSSYDAAQVGADADDAPAYEYTMSYDRTHDFTSTFYTKLPFGINVGLTYLYMSGFPYTPSIMNAGGDTVIPDLVNQFSERAKDFQRVDLSFSKFLEYKKTKVTVGLNVYNLFNNRNVLSVHPLTGDPINPGQYYFDYGQLSLPSEGGEHSSGYYDRPWYFSSPTEVNFVVRLDFN